MLLSLASFAQQQPHLEQRGTVTQLIVDGQPFLMLGGELRNSSSSSLEYMQPLWPRLAAYPMNTILTPLSWEMIEPTEGTFDFSLLDGLLAQARAQHLHIVFLWLAAWKNGVSSYPPVWVKQDTHRFPRAILHGSLSSTLSTLATNSAVLRDADARAFSAVMAHLKQVDSHDHTVLMMQVENEVGTLGDTRDHSDAANRAFASTVPTELTTYLEAHKQTLNPELRDLWLAQGEKATGTWSQVFGPTPRADEIFMAWNYARYVQSVAAAGKSAYPLPMYVNAWLANQTDAPGAYPSGGPQPRVIDVWKAAGSALDLYAPDLYAADFSGWATRFHRPDNPLFIPETNSGSAGAAWVFYAVGEQSALGFSPFAIDNAVTPHPVHFPIPVPDRSMEQAQGNIDLAASYAAILSIAPILLDQQTRDHVHGFNLDKQHPSVTFSMDDFNVEVSLDQLFGHTAAAGYGLLVMTADDGHGKASFLGVGKGFRVVCTSKTPGRHIGFGPIDDGRYEDNKWIEGRRLNGDETDQGAAWRFDSWSLHTERATTYAF
jgi:beta-galactosidase GanA